MFELGSEKSFLDRYGLNRRRLGFLVVCSFELLLVALGFVAATGNTGMRLLSIGLFGLSLYLSLVMTLVGIAVSCVAIILRKPRLFWIISTGIAAIPFLLAIIFD